VGNFVEDKKAGVPAYMVSFGDMMTNLLTFFILMCAMAQQQDAGLLAKGIGSFVAAVETHGRPGLLTEGERQAIFSEIRRRFNLPPEEDPERREAHVDASTFELLPAALATLDPHEELRQPQIAIFQEDSDTLRETARQYLDRIALTVKPTKGQILTLEGHALDAGANFSGNNRWLAFMRALAVREYLIERHDFAPHRVEARAWLSEIQEDPDTRCVDARLITPGAESRATETASDE
jgi:flagellar motor protein MotB